jgi:formate dehydrogenase subunit delta
VTVDVQKLVRMGEQVAANLRYDDDDAALIDRVADHLNRFWDPRMKAAIRRHCENGDGDFSPVLRSAVAKLN